MTRMKYSVLSDVLQHFCMNVGTTFFSIFHLQPVAGAARGAGGHDRRARRGARAAELAAQRDALGVRDGARGEQGTGRKKATRLGFAILYSWFRYYIPEDTQEFLRSREWAGPSAPLLLACIWPSILDGLKYGPNRLSSRTGLRWTSVLGQKQTRPTVMFFVRLGRFTGHRHERLPAPRCNSRQPAAAWYTATPTVFWFLPQCSSPPCSQPICSTSSTASVVCQVEAHTLSSPAPGAPSRPSPPHDAVVHLHATQRRRGPCHCG